MFIVTYWLDGDDETITSVACKTEAEAEEIREILEDFDMTIISVDEINMSTPDEIRKMMEQAYID